MSTKISAVYAAIIDKMEALYPAKQRLHNPYVLENNPAICSKDAWGLRIEEASRKESEYCNISLERTFTAVFLRQFVTLSSKEDGFDAVSVKLMEDQQTFAGSFYSTDEIGQQGNIEMIDIVTISGVQEMTNDEKKYLFSEVTFTILISELIS